MYLHQLPLLQLLIWHSDSLPEAIGCSLQTYTVTDVLLVMYCMCLPAFIVTSADKSQLWLYFGWMDGCCHGDRDMSYIVTNRPNSLNDNI